MIFYNCRLVAPANDYDIILSDPGLVPEIQYLRLEPPPWAGAGIIFYPRDYNGN